MMHKAREKARVKTFELWMRLMEYFDARQFVNLAGVLGLIDSPDLKNFRNGRLLKETNEWNPNLENILRFAVEDAHLSPALILSAMYSGLPQKAKAKVQTLEKNGKTYKFYTIDEKWVDCASRMLLERCSSQESLECAQRALEDNTTIPSAADIRRCFYIHRSMTQGLGNMPAGFGTVAKKAGRSREAYCKFENWIANKYSYPKLDSINLYLSSCGDYHPLDYIVDIYRYKDMPDGDVFEFARENKRQFSKT